MLGLLTANLQGLNVHKEGMKERADRNFCTATELSDQLVKVEKIPFRVAYQIVGSVVGECADAGLDCKAITTEMLDKAAMVYAGRAFGWPQEKVRQALDSAFSVANKESFGAPGPKAMAHMLGVLDENLAADEKARQALVQAQETARAALQEKIDQTLAG